MSGIIGEFYKINAIVILLVALLTSCNTRHEIIAPAKTETYSYVIVRLDFIEQVRQLCEDSLGPAASKQDIATCTLDNMSLLDANLSVASGEFKETYCVPDAPALVGMTPEQLANIQAACAALGG